MKLNFKKNVLLKNYSTFKIGGKADYFFEAKTKKELIEAIKWAKEKKIEFFVFGGASNVLFSDEGFRGLAIKNSTSKFKFLNSTLIAQSGCSLQKLITECAKRGLSGLENLAGIPGTLGGAIYGNAGAFEREIKDVLEQVEILKIENSSFKVEVLSKKECKFGYRESIFKKRKNWIILEAQLRLKKEKKEKIREKIKKFLEMKRKAQPLEFPSAGSVFKNLKIKEIPKKVLKKFKDKIQKNSFLPAWVLIDAAKLRGFSFGGAKFSKKHANFIVNFKKAKAKDVLYLIELAKKKVKEKFGVELKEEIELIGF